LILSPTSSIILIVRKEINMKTYNARAYLREDNNVRVAWQVQCTGFKHAWEIARDHTRRGTIVGHDYVTGEPVNGVEPGTYTVEKCYVSTSTREPETNILTAERLLAVAAARGIDVPPALVALAAELYPVADEDETVAA
jgi:hypothetical protein